MLVSSVLLQRQYTGTSAATGPWLTLDFATEEAAAAVVAAAALEPAAPDEVIS